MLKKFSGFILYILITVLIISLYLDRHESLEKLELFIQDKMFLLRGEKNVQKDVVIVAIDDATLEVMGDWPWNQNKTAQLIDAIAAHEPKTILLNLTFDTNEYQKLAGYTDSLGASLARAGNVIIGYYFSQIELPTPGAILPDGLANSAYRTISNIQAFSRYPPMGVSAIFSPPSPIADSAARLGFINVVTDRDHSVRWQPLIIGYRGEFYPSAQVLAAANFMRIEHRDIGVHVGKSIIIGNRVVPTDRMGRMIINFNGPEKSFKHYSAADVVNKMVSPRELYGKLVIVGYTAFASTDIYSTPVSRKLSGVELMANVTENIIHRNLLKGVASQTQINLAIILIIGLFSAVVLPRISLLNRMVILFLFLVILTNLSYVLFSAFDISTKILYPGLEILILMASAPLMRFRDLTTAKERDEDEEELDYEALLSSSQSLPVGDGGERTASPQHTETIAEAVAITSSRTVAVGSTIADLGTMPVTPASSSSIPVETTDHFGRYKIIEAIGRGAMGTVYKGLDPAIDRLVALKTIRLDQILDQQETGELRERLIREAKAAGKLSHPNIVTIYDVGEEGSVQYIAMEYLRGNTLESIIKSGVNWDYKTLSKVMKQVCEALDYAHENGIIHRDVKPANIMILEGNQVKVMDFGIARLDKSASMTQTGMALGTPNYISPEQLKGQQVDRRSDLFSVGVVFYELLTGEKPFKGDTLSALIYSILHTNPSPPSEINRDVPRIFDKITAKALVKDPDLRFQRAQDMAGILNKLV